MSETLPSHWSVTSLGAIATEIRNGIADKPADEPPGLPILRISAVRPGRVNLSDSRFHRGTSPAGSYHVQDGDLLFIRYNGNRDLAAVCGMVRSAAFPCVYPDKLIRVRLDQTVALPAFVEFAMALPDTRRQLEAFIKTAAGQYGISGRDLREASIPLPPLAEQRRIVARIEALFARTCRARADLERVAPLAKRYREAATERAYMPDDAAGWWQATAGDLAEIKSGITLGKKYPADTSLVERPYLRVANVQRGHLRLDEIKTIHIPPGEAERLTLRRGDVLMNEGGDRDKLGRGWVWNDEIAGCIHQNHVFRVRLRGGDVTPYYLSRYANQFGARYFLDEGKQTTNLASISMSKVAGLPVPVPPPGIAAEIDRVLDCVEASAGRIAHEATRALALLDRLEQSILARAFRGELVPQDANEKPPPDMPARVRPPPPPARRRGVRA